LSAKFVSGNVEPIKLLIVKRKQCYATDLPLRALFVSKLYLTVQISL